MKIKRLTAGLAVAAMAATFFAAAPMLSAQAAAPVLGSVSVAADPTNPAIINIDVTVEPNQVTQLDPWNYIVGWDASGNSAWAYNTAPATINTTQSIVAPATGNTNGKWHLDCDYLTAGITPQYSFSGQPIGSVSLDTTGTPGYCDYDATGVPGTTVVSFDYQVGVTGITYPATYRNALAALLGLTPVPTSMDWLFQGTITVHVLAPVVPATAVCDSSLPNAVCVQVSTQAYASSDKEAAKQAKLSIPMDTPNLFKAANWSSKIDTGFIPTKADLKSWKLTGWGPEPNANTQLDKTDQQLGNLLTADPKNGNTLIFSTPADWSGQIVYTYTIEKIDPSTGMIIGAGGESHTGELIITVHPTLGAVDDLTTDQGVAVTVPLLGKGSTVSIIGTKPFQDAFCWFADTKNKTKDATFGTIKNAGGQKNPVYTPAADFVGDVTLSCTVADKWDPISNTVPVVVHVGTPAPVVPVVPTTPACDKTDSAGKCIISVTGGSLAAPMSSGLAAVVLLVAAGAGILVVRRRTALAG